jgi:hypothetical protein
VSSTAVQPLIDAPRGDVLTISSLPDSHVARPRPVVDQALAELEATLEQLRLSIVSFAKAERSARAAAAAVGGPDTAATSRSTPSRADHEPASDILRRIDRPPEHPNTVELARLLRAHIAAGVYAGAIAPGAKLPSIREVARHFGINHKTAGRVYEALSADRILELRPRSGAYVERMGCAGMGGSAPPEWIANMLAYASERPDGVASLPDLIGRLLGTKNLSCACVDATEDLRVALTSELRHRFGLRVFPLRCEEGAPGERLGDERCARDLEAVDIVVTTPWHSSVLQLALSLGKPIAVVTPGLANIRAIEGQLVSSPLQFVCADYGFGERFRTLLKPGVRDHLHVIAIDRIGAIDRIDSSRPIVISEAARGMIPEGQFVDATPLPPQMGPESSLEIARLIASLIHPW